jgi:hypothetical protein
MDLKKFLFFLWAVTILAIIYIHQESNIFYLAYKNEQKKKILDELVDENNLLRYNTSFFSSLVYLDDKILRRYAEFQMPSQKRIINLSSLKNTDSASNSKMRDASNLVSKIFNYFAKSAEANTLNR